MSKNKALFWCIFFILMSCAAYTVAETIVEKKNIRFVSEFPRENLNDWEEKEFSGHTRYQLKRRVDGVTALYAVSQASASGLFKKIHIDLNKTPYLNWSWKIDRPLKGLNERSKEGDDYAARIYVVKKHALFFWKTRALNYVWSSN